MQQETASTINTNTPTINGEIFSKNGLMLSEEGAKYTDIPHLL